MQCIDYHLLPSKGNQLSSFDWQCTNNARNLRQVDIRSYAIGTPRCGPRRSTLPVHGMQLDNYNSIQQSCFARAGVLYNETHLNFLSTRANIKSVIVRHRKLWGSVNTKSKLFVALSTTRIRQHCDNSSSVFRVYPNPRKRRKNIQRVLVRLVTFYTAKNCDMLPSSQKGQIMIKSRQVHCTNICRKKFKEQASSGKQVQQLVACSEHNLVMSKSQNPMRMYPCPVLYRKVLGKMHD